MNAIVDQFRKMMGVKAEPEVWEVEKGQIKRIKIDTPGGIYYRFNQMQYHRGFNIRFSYTERCKTCRGSSRK